MLRLLGGFSALLLLFSSAQAHHSGASFDPAQTMTLEGTVVEFQWTNPHCYIQLRVSSATGTEEEWSVEMAAPMYLYNLGWRPSTLKGGDQISVRLAPLRSGDKGGLALAVLDSNGARIGRTP